MTETGPWIAAHEGYYGPPLTPTERRALIEWLPDRGYSGYVYSPKDDEFQRARWREPYPDAALAPLAEVVAACHASGLDAGLTISPGLDWRSGDAGEIDALVAKVEQLLGVGADCIGIQWDDVPGGGADVGREHGAAVTAVVDALDDGNVRWLACPVDYAVDTPTEYLAAFAAALRSDVAVVWTGPSVVTDRLAAEHVADLARRLDRRLVFAENYPVNDLGMAGVLHLGPYPARDPDAMGLVDAALVNFMPLPQASRIGLELAARAWRSPQEDHEAAWVAVLAASPELEPLARACRAWFASPDPDPELAAWTDAAGVDDTRLRRFLEHGCRDGLSPELAAEVEPWLEAWEREAEVMLLALTILEDDADPDFSAVSRLARRWRRARRSTQQVFGTRFAVYPGTRRDGQRLLAAAGAVVDEENLTDRLVRRAFTRVG